MRHRSRRKYDAPPPPPVSSSSSSMIISAWEEEEEEGSVPFTDAVALLLAFGKTDDNFAAVFVFAFDSCCCCCFTVSDSENVRDEADVEAEEVRAAVAVASAPSGVDVAANSAPFPPEVEVARHCAAGGPSKYGSTAAIGDGAKLSGRRKRDAYSARRLHISAHTPATLSR